MRSCSSIITIASTGASRRARSSAKTINLFPFGGSRPPHTYFPTTRLRQAPLWAHGAPLRESQPHSTQPPRTRNMAKKQRILVVIDPTATGQPALERAASLAKRAHAQVELLICDYNGELKESRTLGPEAVAKARAALLESRLRRLHELAKPLRANDIDATVDARWDHPLYHGVVAKAAEWEADIVVK